MVRALIPLLGEEAAGKDAVGKETDAEMLRLVRIAASASVQANDVILKMAKEEEAVNVMLRLLDANDIVGALVAIHALASEREFRDRFAELGIRKIAALVGVMEDGEERGADRLGGGGKKMKVVGAEGKVWMAAVRTVAKLMVCSHVACADSIESGALVMLARAVGDGLMDIRLRAAAGLAAIAMWSGPRRAVEIVETDGVVEGMVALLTERDERIPRELRSAIVDALVVMSFRRHARRVLQKHGAEEKIKAVARDATLSGDYVSAARSTVAAGTLSGRSIDEYGFLVEDQDDRKASFKSLGEEDQSEGKTGLQRIQEKLLEEPYTSVEDLNVLEEIVHEDAGVLSSSPRDRNYVRRAARTYGVSADEIDFITALEDDFADANDTQQGMSTPSAPNADPPRFILDKPPSSPNASGDMEEPNETTSLLQEETSVAVSNSEIMPIADMSASPVSKGGVGLRPQSASTRGLSDRNSGSSAHRSSNLFPPVMEDPDFDRNGMDNDDTEAESSAPSSKSKLTSPLVMFSSATKRAAEKDRKNTHLRKSHSQLSKETQNERVWREIMDNQPELLKREKGRSTRVVGYRELAMTPVPASVRRKLWPILLDTDYLRTQKPNLYKTLCRGVENNTLPDDIEHTIEADVTRTMPLHSLFWAGGAQVGVQSLRSILRAYARYVPDVGYCQGMSSIAAVLIMNADDEEEAFLMLVQFMSRFQYKKVFAPGFPLMLQWISELKPLVAHYMPDLNAHMERENVTLELYADKWLITALSHNFPHRYLLRIWDLMFLGGSPKIILKACLAVLRQCEKKLLTMDFENMMPFLQRGFAEPEAGVLDSKDPEPFITMMRAFRFLPDLQRAQKAGAPKTQTNSKTSRPQDEGQSRKSAIRSCFCFKRSQTID